MARYNEILVGRYNRFMQKIFSMKGPASLVTLSDELFPAFPFFNGVENRYLESWERFATQITTAPVAAQFSRIQLRNPAGSNVIAVFEKIISARSGTDDSPLARVLSNAVDLGTANPLTNVRLDNRTRPQPTLVATKDNQASIGFSAQWQWNIFAAGAPNYDVIQYENQEITVLPGDALILGAGVVNTNFVLSFTWRERFLEESERA